MTTMRLRCRVVNGRVHHGVENTTEKVPCQRETKNGPPMLTSPNAHFHPTTLWYHTVPKQEYFVTHQCSH
eukprot:scaffold2199_cov163-Amphora_coffeaeformis.AAC.3